jgi:hypothetical protein
MTTSLLTAGVLAVVAAAIGAGLRAAGIQVPVLRSRAAQITLAALGVVTLAVGVLQREGDSGDDDLASVRYQRQVQAVCKPVRELSAESIIGRPGQDGAFDRAAVAARLRDNYAARGRRLASQLDEPAPESLRDEALAARHRADVWLCESRALLKAFADALPARPTYDHVFAAIAPLNGRFDAAIAPLQDAMTHRSGGGCRLTQT